MLLTRGFQLENERGVEWWSIFWHKIPPSWLEMDSKCACAATAVRCRKSTLEIVKIHRSIKKSPFTRLKNFAHQWIALFFLFNFILSLLLSNHIFVIEIPTNMKHIWSGQHFLLTFLSEGLQKIGIKRYLWNFARNFLLISRNIPESFSCSRLQP